MSKKDKFSNKKDTSWGGVARWYDELLKKDDSYQSKVILPNLIRFLNLKDGEVVLDLACGQGYFSGIFSSLGAKVFASDISKKLIEIAKSNKNNSAVSFFVSPAHKIHFMKDNSVDTIVVVLAIQNIENVGSVLSECYRVLKNNGRIIFVINHPMFRIPNFSDWYFKDGIQHRLIAKYLSEIKIFIDMNPGEKDIKKKIKTISFHRSLQYYAKLFNKNNFVISRIEEWISHKVSQNGPKKKAEDDARKEIPIFMCLEVKKVK